MPTDTPPNFEGHPPLPGGAAQSIEPRPDSATIVIPASAPMVQVAAQAAVPSPPTGIGAPSFFLHRPSLLSLAREHAAAYRRAAPYPHIAFDGFFGAELAHAFADALPSPETRGFRRRDYKEQSARLGQLQRTGFVELAPLLRHVLAELSSMAFLDFLGALTQHEGLIPDPHFRGAGLSLTLPGGHLALHADFNRDRVRHLRRVVTVLYYLGRDWRPSDGGALELWDDPPTACAASYLPILDRLVVMDHGDRAWHGHPAPLTCPAGRFRAVLTAYFYVVDVTPELVAAEEAAHSAIWVFPGETTAAEASTPMATEAASANARPKEPPPIDK